MSANNPVDAAWTKALFGLAQNGTTPVMASLGCSRSDAGDCLYRIGRVTEIRPGALDQAYKDRVMAKMSADELRQIVGWETSAGKLRDKITAASTTGNVDQVHLAEIIIRNTETDQTDDPTAKDGEVHFSQILFAPNDNPDTAADLPETDPAWVKARTDADAAVAELNGITDVQARTDKFAEIAKASSDDDATKAAGGNVDFETRSLMPTNVAAALFDSQHQKGDVIGPIKDETGYYVLLFDERRGTPQERLTALKADIAAGVDWNTLVTKYSDGTDVDKANGADIGWFTRDMLKSIEGDTVDKIFALQPNQISDPIVFSSDSYVFKALDHQMRPLDPNQVAQLTDPDFGAFANWYSDKKNAGRDEQGHHARRPGQHPDRHEPAHVACSLTSMQPYIDEMQRRFGVDPADGLQILSPASVVGVPFDPGIAVLLLPGRPVAESSAAPLPGRAAHAHDAVALLRAMYPADHIVAGLDGAPDSSIGAVSAKELDDSAHFLPALVGEANTASPHGLPWLVARLRAPDGCPWDREQDHLVLRKFLLEETYEVYDALEAGLDARARRGAGRPAAADRAARPVRG